MLFNSTLFLFAFLPIVLGGFLGLQRGGWTRFCVAWLVAASIVFYGWAQPSFLVLLLGSTLGNFGLGLQIQDAGSDRAQQATPGLQAGRFIDWACRIRSALRQQRDLFQRSGFYHRIQLFHCYQQAFHCVQRPGIRAVAFCIGRIWVRFHEHARYTGRDSCASQYRYKFTLPAAGAALPTR